MKKIRAYKRPDGGISIIHDVSGKGFDKATPEGVEYVDIDSSEIPEDRSDREGWDIDTKHKKIKINKSHPLLLKVRAEKELAEKKKQALDNIAREL